MLTTAAALLPSTGGSGGNPRLVRHGETDWSAERRYTGRTDVTLNEAGIAQARALTVIAGDRYDSVGARVSLAALRRKADGCHRRSNTPSSGV